MHAQGTKLNEKPLEDDHPVRIGYLYVLDGPIQLVITSEIEGAIKELKQYIRRKGYKGFTSIMNCDIEGRRLWHLTV